MQNEPGIPRRCSIFPGRAPHPPRPSRRWGAGAALVVLAAVLGIATPEDARAKDPIQLVSTVGQASSTNPGTFERFDAAQAFTTGTDTNGYKLTSVDLHLYVEVGTRNWVYSVSVWSATDTGSPETSLGTLTIPAFTVGAYSNYTYPSVNGIDLDASTTYVIVVDITTVGTGNKAVRLENTTSDNEDTLKATGWSIADGCLYRNWDSSGSWTSFDQTRKIRVNGYAKSDTPNTAATGAPTITGTAQVGETLTAVTTGIADANGLTSPTYTYQWIRVNGTEADIASANSSTYTLLDADLGKALKVRVSFEDDDDYNETLTSAATATVVVVPEVTDVDVTSMPNTGDTYGAGEMIQFTVTFDQAVTVTGTPLFEFCLGSSSAGSCEVGMPPPTRRRAALLSGSGTTALVFSYTVVVDDVDDNGIWAGDQDRTIKLETGDTIQGTLGGLDAVLTHLVVGSKIGHKVNGATANTAVLISNFNQAEAIGSNVPVVSTIQQMAQGFTTGSSQATLTSIELRFYATEATTELPSMTLHSGTPTGTQVASLTSSGSLAATTRTTITFNAPANTTLTRTTTYFLVMENTGSVSILPIPSQSDAEESGGATGWSIADVLKYRFGSMGSFTGDFLDDTVESRAVLIRVNGTLGSTTNTAPMGAPTITGTAQVGETLTAVTTGIADANGLTTPGYTYQWIRANGTEADIASANSSTYILVDADLGKTIKVKVSFTDDASFTETLTSAATATVTAAVVTNTPPTAANNTVTTAQGTAYTFTADDFGFADTDAGATLASVKIVTLPTPGTLALAGTAVLADAVVTKAQIDGNMLTFTPVAGASGTGYASFTFKVNDGTVDSASAYTMTIDVTANPAITIAADRSTATGKIDWIHYTLSRGGDPAAELTVTVTFAGPASNDWSLDTTKTSREVTFTASSATAEQSIQLGTGVSNIGFSESATTSGTLTARLGAKTGYDTSDTDEVQVVVTSGPAWVIKLADDAYRFTEDGGDQNIELVATAASADMPAPSLDNLDKSILKLALVSQPGTATSSAGSADYTPLASARYFPSSTCSADPNASNVQVCRLNVTFTPVDDAEAEPDETLTLDLQSAPGYNPAIHFQGPGPDRTVSTSLKTYTVTIVDDDFGVTGVTVTSTPQQATDTYGAWEHIEISVSFNRSVTVTGAPTFTFDLGGTTTTAAYQGGSGTGTLVFSYQVMPGDVDSDGIAWAADALAGGTIVEMGGTAAPTLTVAVQAALSDHKVDGTQTASGTATVSTVAVTSTPLLMASGSTSADTYGVGETIEFTVTFSAAVTVTGDPQFAFSLSNPPDRLADYDQAASTATALVFRYTVQAADQDTDGLWVGDHTRTLKLDSDDRILTASNNSLPASLTHSEQDTQGSHKVDGSRSAGVNNAPTAANNTVTTGVDTAYTFTADDFGFADTDAGATLASVKIVTVPTPGTLALAGTAVLADDVVTKAQIDGNMLTFTPVAGASGTGYASFTFKVNDGTVDSASAYTMTIDVTDAPVATAPGAPTGLTATANGPSRIDLAWTAPASTGGSAITGYKIEVSPDGSSWSDLVATPGAPPPPTPTWGSTPSPPATTASPPSTPWTRRTPPAATRPPPPPPMPCQPRPLCW